MHRLELEERLRHLLVPRDEADGKDAILEIKAGEGGEESALFAGDLLRMYSRYAERRGWRVELLDETPSDLGGVKSATVAVKAKGTPSPARRRTRCSSSKAASTASSGYRSPSRRAGSTPRPPACSVMPEAEPIDVTIDENDLRIDVFRSSGPGGQSVNTTDSAVRITHLPTGIVVSCQNEKSQLQNREQAMRVLRSRLLALAQDEADAEASHARRSQVRTVDRSERIRTYNFPENRITDHRVGFKAHNLDQVLDGDLQAVIDALVDADLAERLAAVESAQRVTAAATSAAAQAAAAARRLARPVSTRRGTTPRCCSPARSASTVPTWPSRPAAVGAGAGPVRASTSSAVRQRASRSSTSPASPASATSTSRSGPACSCRAPRPR